MNSCFRLYSVTLFVVLLIGCADKPVAEKNNNEEQKLQQVTLALNWFPEAEHGGFYTAQMQGYFEEEGLEVKIIPGGPGVPVVSRVASQQVDFAVGNADQVILGRAQQANIVALMTPLQKSPRCIMVHQESNITSFDQLKDMTLAMNGGRSFAAYLKTQTPLTGVEIVPYSGNLTQFLLDKNYAAQGYIFSEPFTAKEKGANPLNLMLYDIGYNPYTSLLMTSDKLLAEQPDLAQRMTRACIKGWQKYLEEPTDTNAHLQTLNPELSAEMLAFGVKAIVPLTKLPSEESHSFGEMTLDRWQLLLKQMIEAKVVDQGAVEASECFIELPKGKEASE